MDLIIKRPIYFKGAVLLDGAPLKTSEQHGRELLRMGYATAPRARADDDKPAAKSRKKAD